MMAFTHTLVLLLTLVVHRCSCFMEIPCTLSVLGREYTGKMNMTRNYIPCQRWDSQFPHEHSRNKPEAFPEKDISDAENYCRNPDNEPEGPWCYTTDPNTRWQYCNVQRCPSVLAELLKLCKLNPLGSEYVGTLSRTRSGKTCQRWDSQHPHEHSRNNPAAFPLIDQIAQAENYCRNPDGEPEGPWCYTTDSDVRWEYCDVTCCEHECRDTLDIFGPGGMPLPGPGGPNGEQPGFGYGGFGPNSFPEFGGPDQGMPAPEAGVPEGGIPEGQEVPGNAVDPDSIAEIPCKLSVLGREYTGKMNMTRNYIPCQRWDSQSPHEHSRNKPEAFPEGDVSDAKNYCRNPDNEPEGPWCYTTGPNTRWQYCPIPDCPQEVQQILSRCKLTEKGAEYLGSVSRTRSGKTCQRWDSQHPHEHSRNNPAAFPLIDQIAQAENYCRNPDGEPEGPWCYTTDSDVRWEYCDVTCCMPGCRNPAAGPPTPLPAPDVPPGFEPPFPENTPPPEGDSGEIDLSEEDGDYTPADCFLVTHNAVLSGSTDRFLRDVTEEECQLACLEETTFKCMSVDWFKPTTRLPARCALSKRWIGSHPEKISRNFHANHWDRTGCWEEDEKEDSQESDSGSEEYESGSSSGSGSGSGSGFIDDEDNEGSSENGTPTRKCSEGWVYFEGSCYYIELDRGTTWERARDRCANMGARLVSVESEEETNFLESYSKIKVSYPSLVEVYWTGGKQLADGTWVWDMGPNKTPTLIGTHLRWEEGEPNDSGNEGEDHVVFATHRDKKAGFNDFNQDLYINYICENSTSSSSSNNGGYGGGSQTAQEENSVLGHSCDEGWVLFEGTGNCYYLSLLEASWRNAKSKCMRTGARLVSVESQGELEFLNRWSHSQKDHAYVEIYWTAGKEEWRSGKRQWVWDMGENEDELIGPDLQWEPGEPNNANSNEDFIILATHEYGDPDMFCQCDKPFILPDIHIDSAIYMCHAGPVWIHL